MAPQIDAYKTLQVDPEAEDEVIQAAYRRLAQKYHPDRQPDAEDPVGRATLDIPHAGHSEVDVALVIP